MTMYELYGYELAHKLLDAYARAAAKFAVEHGIVVDVIDVEGHLFYVDTEYEDDFNAPCVYSMNIDEMKDVEEDIELFFGKDASPDYIRRSIARIWTMTYNEYCAPHQTEFYGPDFVSWGEWNGIPVG